jgi:tetratricopeptide (TPR) repeat protein
MLLLVLAGCDKPPAPVPPPPPPPVPVKVDPDPAAAVKKVDASLASGQGDWAALEKELAEFIAKKPSADLHSLRGRVLEKLGREDEALAEHSKAIALASDRHELRKHRLGLLERRKAWGEITTDLDFLIAGEESSLELRRARAKARMELALFAEAAQDLTVLLNADPENAELRLARATCSHECTNRELAVADITHVIRAKPSADLYARRALFQRHSAWFDKARDDYQAGLALDANHLDCLIGLAALKILKATKDALALAERAVAAHPKSAHAWFLRGQAKYLLGHRNEAIDDLDKSVELDGGLREQVIALKSTTVEQILKERKAGG